MNFIIQLIDEGFKLYDSHFKSISLRPVFYQATNQTFIYFVSLALEPYPFIWFLYFQLSSCLFHFWAQFQFIIHHSYPYLSSFFVILKHLICSLKCVYLNSQHRYLWEQLFEYFFGPLNDSLQIVGFASEFQPFILFDNILQMFLIPL